MTISLRPIQAMVFGARQGLPPASVCRVTPQLRADRALNCKSIAHPNEEIAVLLALMSPIAICYQVVLVRVGLDARGQRVRARNPTLDANIRSVSAGVRSSPSDSRSARFARHMGQETTSRWNCV